MNIERLKQLYSQLMNTDTLHGWHQGYKATIKEVEHFRSKIKNGYELNAETDEEFLAFLLKNDKNGVASKGQSNISNTTYNKLINNKNFLLSVEKLILKPNLEHYTEFRSVGENLLNALGSTKYPLLFNRACASCTLMVSVAVDEKKFNQILNFLSKNEIIELPSEFKNQNWYVQNEYLIGEMHKAFKDELLSGSTDEFWLNIFIWQIYLENVVAFNAAKAISFLKDRYPETYTGTSHIAAFRTLANRPLALDPKSQTPIIICDTQPPEHLMLALKQHYTETDSRHHHLKTHAKELDVGNQAYSVIIKDLNDLEKFCHWYELTEYKTELNLINTEEKDMQNHKNNQPLNQILFGPAGTGKTYHSVNHALQIIDPDFYEANKKTDQRATLTQEFQKYVENGQIQFVTFHQSFSYEDFIEGIRVETREEVDHEGNLRKQLEYPIVAGVFKKMCELATGAYQQAQSIDDIVDQFLEEIAETSLALYTQQNKKITVSYAGRGLTIQCQPSASENKATYPINISQIKSLLSGEGVEKSYNMSYVKAVAEYLKPRITTSNPPNIKKNFVIIIDEINRGNISRIFGELITLIEASKRQGNAEQLSTVLPYSKKKFSVPNNLYIIGTMNSSDRSLTGLDLALRRRFTFIEMAPNPSTLNGIYVDGINIEKLLEILNQRIEILLDRDHCIGHAYFFPLKNNAHLNVLKEIFLQNIIPLLQEYFFDDWEHINLVLNENGMLRKKNSASLATKLFKSQRPMSRDIWEIDTQNFDSAQKYIEIYQNETHVVGEIKNTEPQ